MKMLNKHIIALMLIISSVLAVNAQTVKQTAKAQGVKSMINGMDFIFKANYVTPMRGGSKALTSDYDMVVSKDTINVFLPYFGQAYIAPNDPTEGGIKFKTTHFDYKSKINKKGGWDILIVPRDRTMSDMRDVQSLRLSVTSSGYASLHVTSTNRDPISFDGYVEERKR